MFILTDFFSQCESLYLIGVQMLLLDRHFPGALRERLLVSNHRFGGDVADLEEVCKLMRAGAAGGKKQGGTAEILFE